MGVDEGGTQAFMVELTTTYNLQTFVAGVAYQAKFAKLSPYRYWQSTLWFLTTWKNVASLAQSTIGMLPDTLLKRVCDGDYPIHTPIKRMYNDPPP